MHLFHLDQRVFVSPCKLSVERAPQYHALLTQYAEVQRTLWNLWLQNKQGTGLCLAQVIFSITASKPQAQLCRAGLLAREEHLRRS